MRVLLGGSYDRKKSLFLGRLDTLEFQEILPVNEDGESLGRFGSFGRRNNLHLATEVALHVVDLCGL
jgi:hypothetical protein